VGGICYAWPAIRLLRDDTIGVMVPVEGHEHRELHPTVAQFFVGVITYLDRQQTLLYNPQETYEIEMYQRQPLKFVRSGTVAPLEC
jgi:hypothetical protein